MAQIVEANAAQAGAGERLLEALAQLRVVKRVAGMRMAEHEVVVALVGGVLGRPEVVVGHGTQQRLHFLQVEVANIGVGGRSAGPVDGGDWVGEHPFALDREGEEPVHEHEAVGHGSLRHIAPGELFLALDSAKGQPKSSPDKPNPSFTASRHESNPRRLRNVQRGLLKLAVEFAWLDLGENVALGESFDHARQRVIDDKQGEGYLLFPEKTKAAEEIGLQYARRRRKVDQHPIVAVLATFWGFPLFTDSLLAQPEAVPPGFILQTFN